jgi:hypothetical protein
MSEEEKLICVLTDILVSLKSQKIDTAQAWAQLLTEAEATLDSHSILVYRLGFEDGYKSGFKEGNTA